MQTEQVGYRIFHTGLSIHLLKLYRQLRRIGFSRYDVNLIIFGMRLQSGTAILTRDDEVVLTAEEVPDGAAPLATPEG